MILLYVVPYNECERPNKGEIVQTKRTWTVIIK